MFWNCFGFFCKRKDDGDKKEDKKSGKNVQNIGPNCCCLQRGRLFLVSLGALFIAFSYAIYSLNPVELITKHSTAITDGSFAFKIWKKPPLSVTVKIYLFNVTNAEEFLRGEENLKVQQVGPYMYNEFLENTNVTFNDNNTLTFTPTRKVTEDSPPTGADPRTDVITALNIPFLGVASFLADHSIIPNLAFNTFTSMLDVKPFLTMTVQDYLWGYDDPMVSIANRFMPSTFTFERMGYMDRIFDEGRNIITTNLNSEEMVLPSGQVVEPKTFDSFNGEPGLSYYGYKLQDNTTHKKCNTLQGVAGDGVLFPRNIKKSSKFHIYRKVFCRTMPLVFDSEAVSSQGIPGYEFTFPNNSFDNNIPENSCYCRPEDAACFPNGLSEMRACYWRMPVAVSFPHLLHVNYSEIKTVEGLNPSVEDHGTSILIQPDVGVILRGHSRVQANLMMGNIRYNPKLKPFSNMVLPIFWTDFSMDNLPTDIALLVWFLVVLAPIVQVVAMILFAVLGVFFLGVIGFRTLCTDRWQRRRKESQVWRGGYDGIKIIPIARHESLIPRE